MKEAATNLEFEEAAKLEMNKKLELQIQKLY